MNRIDICKNIIQSINKYITNPDILEAHRQEKHFIRKRKLSMFQIILYLLYSSKASMFQNLSAIRDELRKKNNGRIANVKAPKSSQFFS